MEFAPSNLNIAKLKRKMDISNLTVQVAGVNIPQKGRFCMLWRDGNFIVIQAEPWWRQGVSADIMRKCEYLEENRALSYFQEVIQTMLDTIVFDGESNWAYLVRLKNGTYRLVYEKRRCVRNFTLWTKVVELDDIELTRFVSGFSWEGIYEEKDVDLFIGWHDNWAPYVLDESHGQKLVESMGLGQYFFELKAHVAQNGIIVGFMKEAIVGRPVTLADRCAVYEAVADIQQHGLLISLQMCEIYITERGVRFASASTAKYYQDRDELAKEAESTWNTLADIFNEIDNSSGWTSGSRSFTASAVVIPRLPSLGRPISLTHEEAIIRWSWSIVTSDAFHRLESKALGSPRGSSEDCTDRRDKRVTDDCRTLLPPDDFSGVLEDSDGQPQEKPFIVNRRLPARYHPYTRSGSKRLLLSPQESDEVVQR